MFETLVRLSPAKRSVAKAQSRMKGRLSQTAIMAVSPAGWPDRSAPRTGTNGKRSPGHGALPEQGDQGCAGGRVAESDQKRHGDDDTDAEPGRGFEKDGNAEYQNQDPLCRIRYRIGGSLAQPFQCTACTQDPVKRDPRRAKHRRRSPWSAARL